eukprot:937193-Rhodomonas_salina.1
MAWGKAGQQRIMKRQGQGGQDSERKRRSSKIMLWTTRLCAAQERKCSGTPLSAMPAARSALPLSLIHI